MYVSEMAIFAVCCGGSLYCAVIEVLKSQEESCVVFAFM